MRIVAGIVTGAATLFAAFLVIATLRAQELTGEVRIEVKDPSGRPMEATGKLQNVAIGVTISFQTDPQGSATVPGLAVGRYSVEVTKSGFAAQPLIIDVTSGDPVTRTVQMAIGSQSYKVDVIGTTPLPGVERSLDEIASNVQTANANDIESSGALDLSEFMNRRLSGVYLNEIQGNPIQPDLNFHGYTASPLLGTPQGVSIYMDGVRLNQPFGDVVSWDLIPRIAISEMTMMPGSNPLFGLNTLGGALALQSKDGRTHPGTMVDLSGGSFGRKVGQIEHGGSNKHGLSWYGAANMFFEDGWRQASPSNVRQFFGKVGWQGKKTVLGLSVAYANNSLTGNGLQEQRFVARDYASVYTNPDQTANRSPFLNFSLRHALSNNVSFAGNVYYRYIRTDTLNGDINDNSLDQSIYQPSAADQAALRAAGYSGFPTSGANAANTPFPFWRCIAQALQRDEPGEKCNGLLNTSHSEQHNGGVSGQMSWNGAPRGHHNQFTAGAGWDRSSITFNQLSQLGFLNPNRTVTGVPAFADGITGGNVDGVPLDTRVGLEGHIQTGSVFATDTLSLGRLNLTFSGRYNRTVIDNKDLLQPQAGPGSLTGANAFGRFNPAVGLTYNIGRLIFYASYAEGSRAPTSIELGCADPNAPCRLPNALAGDPPLKQVLTRTVEAGIRSSAESRLRWNINWFGAQNNNDILFVASPQTGFGYFKNFGKTRRTGVDVDVNTRLGRVTLGGGYTFLNATYQSPETVNGSNNSANDSIDVSRGLEGNVQIEPGDRIPLVPQHLLKAYADFQATSKFAIDLSMNAVSSSYARGNENNMHQPDGTFYLGPGTSPGYGVANLGGRYQVRSWIQIYAEVNNLLDHRYYSGAQLGATGFDANGNFSARPFPAVNGNFPILHATFYAPGAPIGAWGGLRFRF
jgi:outer membrane receptor protein involved in Fe transport